MKPFALIFALLIAFTTPVLAQSQQEDQASKPKDSQKSPKADTKETTKDLKGFVDTDGDGIDDRKVKTAGDDPGSGNGVRKRERKRDNFIDSDGDGINDNRCNGLGIGSSGKQKRRRGGRK